MFGSNKTSTKVFITNNSGMDIKNLCVVHKYSNNYKELLDFNNIKNRTKTGKHHDKIYYNVGVGTTGKDWWYVVWEDTNGKKYINTTSTFFRGIYDFFDTVYLKTTSFVVNIFNRLGGNAIPGGNVVNEVYKLATTVMNNEKTTGFKQHILRKKDAAGGVEILINSKKEILIISSSGTSTTTWGPKK